MINLEKSLLLKRYPHLSICKDGIIKTVNLLIKSYEAGGTLFIMGNGGSSADAEHICGELVKGFLSKRPLTAEQKKQFDNRDKDIPENLQNGLPSISLGVSHSLISAFLNDVGPENIYAQQIWVLGRKNDTVLGISTSGNSLNIVQGLKTARARGLQTIALTGEKNSRCKEVADICIQAPARETHKIQELHLPIYHSICIELEYYFFSEKP